MLNGAAQLNVRRENIYCADGLQRGSSHDATSHLSVIQFAGKHLLVRHTRVER